MLICSIMWSSQRENFISVCSHCSNPGNYIFHLVLSRPKGRAVSCHDIFPLAENVKTNNFFLTRVPTEMKGIVGTSGGQIQPGEWNKILRKHENEESGRETGITQDRMRPLLKPPSAVTVSYFGS